MTTYYVDGGAAGTADGLSPANAFVSVLSVPAADNNWTWVRNTHREVLANASICFGNSWALEEQSKRSYFIGWPQAGMAFYNERPAAGVSASWDSDVPTTAAYTLVGLKMPTLVASSRLVCGYDTYLANFYCTQSATATMTGFFQIIGLGFIPTTRHAVFDNIVPMFNEARITTFGNGQGYVRKVTIIASVNNTNISDSLIAQNLTADQVIISSLSQGRMLGANIINNIRIGHLVNYSSSVDHLIGNGGGNDSILGEYRATIRRISGVQPYVSDAASGSTDSAQPLFVDDYYGLGPRILQDSANGRFAVPSLGIAAHSGEQVVKYDVASIGVTNTRFYGDQYILTNPIVRAYFNTVSGTALNIKVPIYTDSTGVFSLAMGVNYGTLGCAGAGPYSVGTNEIGAGVAGEWSGTFISGGSAYVAVFSFLPTETASNVPFDFFTGGPVNTTSGSGKLAYMFVGRPQ
jgi:hypothetical protein